MGAKWLAKSCLLLVCVFSCGNCEKNRALPGNHYYSWLSANYEKLPKWFPKEAEWEISIYRNTLVASYKGNKPYFDWFPEKSGYHIIFWKFGKKGDKKISGYYQSFVECRRTSLILAENR